MAIGKVGKYERLEILGHGASGIVYLAWDTLLRRNIALKEIRTAGPEMERVLSEARVLDRLRHPNIIEVHSVDVEGDVILLDMELIRGKNLAEVLRARMGEPLPPADAVRITQAVLEALAFAHERRILHKDVKPANILVGDDGTTVKLTDFGLSEALGTASLAGGGGTYPYMAPEDFSEDASSDYRSDLWAVGVMLYEMLTGKRPFLSSDTRNPFAWKAAIENTVVPPTGMSEPVDTLITRALAKAKTDRFPTARAFAEALRTAAPSLPSPSLAEGRGVASEGELKGLFIFSDGTEARTLDTLLTGAAKNWDESRRALLEGRFSRFLRGINEPYIAELAAELAARADIGQDRKLREFLERARPDEPQEEDAEHTIPFAALKEKLARFDVGQLQVERPGITVIESPKEKEQAQSVRWWFFPVLLACCLPTAAAGQAGSSLLLVGLALTGLVGAMLLLVSIGSRQPVWTRILCLFPVGIGVMAAGILTAQSINGTPTPDRLFWVSATALVPLGLLLIQAATARQLWRLWLALLLLLVGLAVALLARGLS